MQRDLPFDLNLLMAFNAMLDHRNVTKAGESLGLSQPAMSSALKRLRTHFEDPLFVRAGLEMRATPRATELAPAVRQVVRTVKQDILQPVRFDHASSSRTFTILAPDIAEANLLPAILRKVSSDAPNLNLRTLGNARHVAAESLTTGLADMAIGYFPDLLKAGFFRQRLFQSHHVCMVRSGHPTISRTLNLSQFLKASHVLVRPEGREHMFERYLADKGLQVRVQLEVSHFLSLLPILEATDLVATVPEDFARMCERYGRFRLFEPPFKMTNTDVQLFWHPRLQKDPGLMWLRKTIHGLFTA
jgi:DNA-binding transcriptional LysR family regulator